MPEHDDDGSSSAASTSEFCDDGSSPDAFMSDRASSPAASAYGFIDDGFSSPDLVSDFDRGGTSPAASMSEPNDVDPLSSAPSPIPSEPVSRFSTPPSNAHVASTHTPPSNAQNVGSRQGKKPSKSTPHKEVRDGKERTAARCVTSSCTRMISYANATFAAWRIYKIATGAACSKMVRLWS